MVLCDKTLNIVFNHTAAISLIFKSESNVTLSSDLKNGNKMLFSHNLCITGNHKLRKLAGKHFSSESWYKVKTNQYYQKQYSRSLPSSSSGTSKILPRLIISFDKYSANLSWPALSANDGISALLNTSNT